MVQWFCDYITNIQDTIPYLLFHEQVVTQEVLDLLFIETQLGLHIYDISCLEAFKTLLCIKVNEY